MTRAAPFAYGHHGRLLSSSHEDEVFTCGADDEAPLFIHQLGGAVAGIRHTAAGVLALDELGELSLLSVPTGEPKWTTGTGVSPVGLAATDAGRWAVLHQHGALLGQGPQQDGSVDVGELVGGCFDNAGAKLGLVSATGTLTVVNASDGSQPWRVDLGVAANGVAWSALGWWLISTERGVFRWAPGDAEATLYLKWGGDGAPQRVVASADGRLCAFVSEDKYVVVFGVEQDINGGAIVYFERTAGELEFGPGNMLGIGIGLGDGNKIDLLTGDLCRTDPPPGRERNRWMVKIGLDFDDIRRALGVGQAASQATSQAAAEAAGQDEKEGMSTGMKLLVFTSLGLAGYAALRMLLAMMS